MIELNGKPVDVTIFPDGTSQVWKLDNILDENVVTWYFESEAEVIHLCQLATLLSGSKNVLEIPYLPYARQDKNLQDAGIEITLDNVKECREFLNSNTFSLTNFAMILNHCVFPSFRIVCVVDLHSDKLSDRLNQFDERGFTHPLAVRPTILDLHPQIGKLPKDYDVVIFPDGGARSRYEDMMREYHPNISILHCVKERDQQTGYITRFEIAGDEKVDVERILVYDDLCDGGKTFEILAESLIRDHSISDDQTLDLYVSHGLFSKGVDKLLYSANAYNNIHTTNSLIWLHHLEEGSKQCYGAKTAYRAVKEGRLHIHDWKGRTNAN